jgi:nickel/cobalt transporter (NicO) family protein
VDSAAGQVDSARFTIAAPVLLAASVLVLGFLHGLGADHLMAVAALSVGGVADTAAVQRARALSVAFRFACGHALLLAIGAGGLLALGWSLPLMFERAGEIVGGVLLIGLGVVGIWGLRAGRVYGHSHQHGREPAAHWHLHLGRRDRHPLAAAHSHLPTIIGAAFALSSIRALATLAPFGGTLGDMPLLTLLALIAVFGVGILLSMSLFGVAFARVMSAAAAARIGQAAGLFMALTSIVLGVFWIATA